jgi:TPR repeat protein
MSFNQRESSLPDLSAGQNGNNGQYSATNEVPHLSPFPQLVNRPANVPLSDVDLEATLENARTMVLNSNDPEMQLAWAADALVYVGVCADDAERDAVIKPQHARPATPRIEHQLKTDAMSIVTFLADQHHPKAEYLRAAWLEWGRFGQREDKKEAFRCYSRAADRGYARAEYRIGLLYESYNDPIKALRHYHRGIDAGDAASCYRLGMMTLRGQHGQQQDFARGIDLVRRSAQGADENAAQGAYVYGLLLARQLPQVDVPEGYLPYDERQARINIEKAAYLKMAKAQLKMGSAYELGSLGCDFNPAMSMHYNALASKQGEAEADMALSKWFLVGHEGLFPKNEELAYHYAQRAAQSSLSTAEFALGYFNEIGMYVPVDLDKSLEWYEKAAKHGNEDAKGRIVALSHKQVLSRKDHETIAITRIKSQYGSQHGVRPERFRQSQPSRLAQSTSVGDDPSLGSQGPAVPFHGNAVQPPPRSASITPYPVDDRPPTMQAEGRSASVAPYPLDDGPPKTARLGPTGGFFNASQPPRPATTINAEMRPSSAFQLSPDLRASSTQSVPQLPSQPGYGGRPPYQGSENSYASNAYPPNAGLAPRPATAVHPADPRARLGAGQRIVSGPAGLQNYNHGPGLSPAASPRPGQLQHPTTTSSAPPPQNQSQLDIGFSAPFDERRSRPYGPSSTPRPPTHQESVHVQPVGKNPHSLPSPQSGRTSTPASRTSSRPPTEMRPSPIPPSSSTPKLPSKDSLPALPSATGASVAKPPAKGPKTFEEMGVPSSKKEGECAVM